MTENEAQLTGRLHALELLPSQTLAEMLRSHTDSERVEISARMMAALTHTLAGAPPSVTKHALETGDKILKKAVMDSL